MMPEVGYVVMGALPTRKGYTGQRAVMGIGLHFYNARHYDSSLGRFVEADSLIARPEETFSWDRYQYVESNPILYFDSTGHWPELNLSFNTMEFAQTAINWGLDKLGLSDQGYNAFDVSNTISNIATGLDLAAGAIDSFAVGLSFTTMIAVAPEATPVFGFVAGEMVASPFLIAANLLATGAT